MAQQLRLTFYKNGEVILVDRQDLVGLSKETAVCLYGTPKTDPEALRARGHVEAFEKNFKMLSPYEQDRLVAEYLCTLSA